jgi:hypothetical protein
MLLTVTWAEIKSHIDSRSIPLRYIEKNSHYQLVANDGFVDLTCRLDKNPTDTTDLLDFEQNYKSAANAPQPLEVVSQFEKDTIVLKTCCLSKETTNQEVTLEFKVPGTYGSDWRYIRGGEAWFGTSTLGDKVTDIHVVDKDNITGLGVGAILKSYTDVAVANHQNSGWFIKDVASIRTITGMGSLPAQLYLQITAVKAGGAEDTLYVNLLWGREE